MFAFWKSTFNPVRSKPEQIAEEHGCPAEHTSKVTPETEQMDQAITSVIRLEPGHNKKQQESQQDVTRAKFASNSVKLPNFRKRKKLRAKKPLAVTKKSMLRLDATIDFGKGKNFDETASSSPSIRYLSFILFIYIISSFTFLKNNF